MASPNSNDSLINDRDLESLNFVLVDICEIEQAKVDDIIKKCRSITELLNNINLKDYFQFELTIEEKTKIVRFGNLQRWAALDIEESDQIYGEKNSLGTVIEYALADNHYDENIKKKKREIYEKYKENFHKIYEHEYNKRRKIQKYGNYLQVLGNFTAEVLPNMARLAREYPFISRHLLKGIFSISDELLEMLGKWGSIKGNAISGLIIFGTLTTISLGQNLKRYYKEKDSGTFTLGDALWCTVSETAIHGASSATIAAFGAAGGFIGTCVPFIGNIIGGLVGSLIGLLVSSKLVEPAIRNLQKQLVVKNLERNLDIKMYKEALRKFNIQENTKVSTIKDLRRIYRLENHPDKNLTDQTFIDEKTQRFIEFETYFRIIEAYRKANNTWTD